MKTTEKIEKLYDEFDVKKDGSILIIHTDVDGHVNTYSCGAKNEIASTIAAIIDTAISDDECAEGGKFIAHTILKGVKAVLSIPSRAGRAISMYFTLAIADALENVKKGIFTPEDAVKHQQEEEDEEDDEDCEHCKANRICPLPQAVKFRKENHIPAPAKRKNKKHCEEKGS